MKPEHIKEDVFVALREQEATKQARLHAVGLTNGERFDAFVTGYRIERNDSEHVLFTVQPDHVERVVALADIDFVAVRSPPTPSTG